MALTHDRRPEAAPFSRRTPRVVAAIRLHRRRERDAARLFLAEGPQAIREALAPRSSGAGRSDAAAGSGIVEVFGTPAALTRHTDLVDRAGAAGARISPVTEDALAALAETVTPQGLVAVCGFLDVPLEAALSRAPRLVAVLYGISDPGNAGTVLRTADAAGAGTVIFAADAVDPYNGKCVRASAGSLFHVDVVRAAPSDEVVPALRRAGLRVLAADAHGDRDLFELSRSGELTRPTAWVFGSEAHGLPDELAGAVDARVRVPILGRAESLNLAAAAAVCLYASASAAPNPVASDPVAPVTPGDQQ